MVGRGILGLDGKRHCVQDLTGKKFGRLTVLRFSHIGSNTHAYWECECSCPSHTRKIIDGNNLKHGTKSCGCYAREVNKTHGDTSNGVRSRLYTIWHGMRARCTNPKSPSYKNYGGRGVTICTEWLESYEVFRDWAITKGCYKKHLTLDRIDNNKLERGYSPENCRFVSKQIQNRNKRSNHVITFKGKAATLSDWADITGISVHTLSARLNTYGWTIEKALTTPVRPKDRLLEYNGEVKSLTEWGDETGVGMTTLSTRLRLGWDVEKALTTPVNEGLSRKEERLFLFEGEYKTLRQLCAKYKKNYNTMQTRLSRGWTIEEAINLDIGNGEQVRDLRFL